MVYPDSCKFLKNRRLKFYKMPNEIDLNIPKVWLRILLTLIPLASAIYSCYWVINVAQPIFVKAVGVECAIIGAILLVASLVSAILAIPGLKKYNSKNSVPMIFSIYILITLVSFCLLVAALIHTSVSSQSTYEYLIGLYTSQKTSDSATTQFAKSYLSQYDKMKYYFLVGNNSFDIYVIISAIWVVCFVAYFIVTDVFDVPREKR